MGGDGGTIPKRVELIRQTKKAEPKDKDAANMAKWRHCALKHDTLKQPIVVDSRGLLYNKDSILEYLLDRAKFEHGPSYIKKMKDVKELQLTENPSFNSNHNALGNEYLDVYLSPFICPFTNLQMNGKYKFCAIWTCGCVLSDQALRTVNSQKEDNASCPKCGQDYSPNDDIIILNPEDEECKQRLPVIPHKNGLNKRKSPEVEENSNNKKIKNDSNETLSSSSTTTKTLASKTVPSKLKKTLASKTVPSKLKKTSIQQDPTKSDLYKSLFTTSDAAKKKEQNKAHWITYNPLYY